MRSGDEVKIKGKPEYGTGTIIRFYANQGTALVDFKGKMKLKYCDYQYLIKQEKKKGSVSGNEKR